jgi:SAM-dependent methyltransferase
MWGWKHGAAWLDDETARAYLARPPHPEETILRLVDELGGRGGRVLDLGTGTGELARRLAPLAVHVDAVDVAAPMLALARKLPGGDAASIRWLEGRAEDAALEGPYDLVVAGDSIHWMDWQVLFRRLGDVLRPEGHIAILTRMEAETPWGAEARRLYGVYSANQDWLPLDIVEELRSRGCFEPVGAWSTVGAPVRQTVDTYLDVLHSSSGFSRARMPPESIGAFDAAMRTLIAPHLVDGHVEWAVSSSLVWGRPGPAARS